MTIQQYNDIFKNPITKSMSITSSGGITITNTNICLEEMSLEESLCSDGNLTIGACESACFKIRIADMNHNFEGELLTVNQIIPIDQNTDETIPYGVFKVISDKATNDRKWRDLTCYDAMYDILNADVSEWFNSLTFPMTVKNLRDSFFTYLGVTQVTTTLVNDNFQTQGGFSVSGVLSGKDIITAICEINGVFGHISREGQFEYISLPSADSLTLDWYMDGTGAYEDYLVQKITGIVARSSESDVGTSVGTDTNVYVIQDNPLIYGTEGTSILITALTNVLNNVNDIMYRPFNVSTYGNPMLPLGTNLTIETRNQTINSFVMSRLLTGIQSLKDSYSAVGDKNRPSEVNSLRSEINRTKGKIHELVVTTDELRSTISSIEEIAEEASEDASDAKQTAEGVATDLSTNYFTKSETTSEISQSATSILSTVSQTYTPKASTIKTDTLHYLATSQSSGVTTSTPGWTTTIQSVTSTDKYLWTYHTYTYADDHTSDTIPIITGVYGDQGQQGGAGPQGPTGTGISTVTPLYYAGTSTKPSKPTSVVTSTSTSGGQWTKAIPSLSTTYPNLYTCDQVYYTNGTYSWSDVVSDINSTTSYSEISQLKDKIVLKVDNNGKIVKAALSADPSTGSTFSIDADYISFVANKTIDLVTGNIAISANNFSIDNAGNVTLTGTIHANAGDIAGWTIDSTKLSKSWDDGAYSGSMEINSADTTITAIRDGRSKMEYRGDCVLLTSNYNNDGTYYRVLELGFMSGSIWTGSRDTGYIELFDTTNGAIDKRIDIDAATSQINVYSNSSTSSTVSSSGFYSTGFTGDRVACINASKRIVSSDVTPTELGYLSGATSNIQGQIDDVSSAVHPHIYGVKWDWANSDSPTLTRTDISQYFENPVAGLSNGKGSSPFDTIYPWCNMKEVEDGEAGTLVSIPKFWYKITNTNNVYTLRIADAPVDGFHVSPAHIDRGDGKGERDVVFVGRYHCDSNYQSKGGSQPIGGITRATARTNIHALGNTIYQFDYLTMWTIRLLYLVEFANFDSQSQIGYGCSPNGAKFNMGYTDSMQYHTGTTKSARSAYGGTQYRHIEGLWDNVVDFVDGMYYTTDSTYIIKNPSLFGESGGVSIGSKVGASSALSGNNSVINYAISQDGIPCPIGAEVNDTNFTKYTCDKVTGRSNGVILLCGGAYGQNRTFGLFNEDSWQETSLTGASVGCRLIKLP